MSIAVRVARSTAALSSPATVSTTGISAGDRVLLHVRTGDNVTPTVPAGFTLVPGAEIASANSIRVYEKIATGSEGATYSVSFSGGGTARLGLVAIYSDAGADLLLDGVATQSNGSSTNLTCPSITTSIANALLLCFVSINSAVTTTAPGSMTKQYDTGATSTVGAFTETIAGPGATGTRVPTGSSAQTNRTVSMAWAEELPPDAPSGLTAEAITASRIDLAWTDNSSDEDSFSVEQSLNGSTGWTEVATPAANATSVSITGLAANTTYFFRVKAVNSGGSSAASNTAQALTLFAPNSLSGARMFLLSPDVVLAAQVNWPTATYPLDLFDVDNITVGAVADAKAGMTLLLGTTPGGDDLGRQRMRKDGAGARLFVGRSSRGTHDGELTVINDAFVTVLDDRRVWAKMSYIAANGDIFKDSDLPVEDRTTEPPPVAVMGQGYAATCVEGVITAGFIGSNSYAVADGATITDYLWDIQDGLLTIGALTDDNITATFPPGFRYVSLTVTDSNGHSHTTYRPVLADDPDDRLSFEGFAITNRRYTDAGVAVTVAILEDMPSATYPDGTLCLIWDKEPTGAFDRDHMLIVGWLGVEENSVNAGKYGLFRDTTLTIEDVGVKADSLPGFPQSLADDDTRDTDTLPAITWNYMVQPTMDRYMHYLLQWHSTILDVADFLWSDTGDDYRVLIKSSDGESLWQQVKRVAQAMLPGYVLTCDQAGRVRVVPDPQLQDEGFRTDVVQIDFDEDHYSDYRFTYQRSPRTHWLRAGAILVQDTVTYNEDGSLYLPTVFSIAPGDTPGQGLGEVDNNEGLAASQEVLNSATGHRYARENMPIKTIVFTLVQDDGAGSAVPWRTIEPALKEWVTYTIGAESAARRGQTASHGRGLPLEVNVRYNNSKYGVTRTIELTVEPESIGVPGQTVTKPDVPAVGVDPLPPTTPPDFGLREGVEAVAAIGLDGYVYVTSDFQTPSGSGGPTWSRTNLSIAEVIYSFVVDPFSPGYIDGAGAINGWLATEGHIYRIADLFGTPAKSSVLAFATTADAASYHWRSIQASFGRYFENAADNPWLVCVSYYGSSSGHEGTWATYSMDAGATWSAEVQISAYTDPEASPARFNPIGVYASPKTPGFAYAAAWREAAALDEELIPAWGTSTGSGDYTYVDSISVSESVYRGEGEGLGSNFIYVMPHPPDDAKRIVVQGTYTIHAHHDSGAYPQCRITFTPGGFVTYSQSFSAAKSAITGPGNFDVSVSGDFTITITRAGANWPNSKEDVTGSPPTGPVSPQLSIQATTANAGGYAEGDIDARITEIELTDGTIYNPGAAGADGQVTTDWGATWAELNGNPIDPGNALAGSIHVPWPSNDDEGVLYYGQREDAANRQFRLIRVAAGVSVDISPSDGGILFGVNRFGFTVRSYDSDRSYVMLAGTGNDTSADADDDVHGVFYSNNFGDTWTTIVAPIADSAGMSGRPAFEAAFSGNDPATIFIWGPPEYIGYSTDAGATIDDRSGNLASFSPSAWCGIAGGPTG